MTTDLDHLLVSSPNINQERLDVLRGLFPDLFTDEGKPDPIALRQLLEGNNANNREQYSFTWHGKARSKRHAFTPSRAALTYDPKRSINPDKAAGNMIIEGENLEVLKLLTSAYREKVKCIYIDPPYNTGGDFIYPDNYTKERKEYWEENGSYQNGVKMDTNPETNGRYHSDWLSMMYSRLLIARQLLREDGVIFASIDDAEVHNLRKVMDDVFGEENFVACVTIKGNPRGRDYGGVARMHDFLLVYTKFPNTEINGLNEPGKEFPYVDSNGGFETRELRNRNIAFHVGNRPNLYYPFYVNIDEQDANGFFEIALEPKEGWTEVYPKESQGYKTVWRWGKSKSAENLNLEIVAKEMESGGFQIVEKYRKTTRLARSIWDDKDVNTEKGTLLVKEIFNSKVFSFPKPVEMIMRIIEMGSTDDDVVLDFFAGSGTTAHALMLQNLKDMGRRRFILIQLPEAIDKIHEAYKAGYRTISQITIERNKRVIEGYGDNLQPINTGFKVYRLTKSHFPRAEFQPDPDKSEGENIEALKRYIAEKEASFQMVFDQDEIFDEVLLKHGFLLDYSLSKQEEFTSNAIYLADDGIRQALICLDLGLTDETVEMLRRRTDRLFICLERALDTTKKWNLKHSLGDRLKAV